MTEELRKGMVGLVVDESSISLPQGDIGKLSYRGILIEDLAFNSTYLETAYLLLFGKLPNRPELDKFTNDVRFHTRLKVPMVNALWQCATSSHPHPMTTLQTAAAMLGIFYPVNDVLDEQLRYDSTVRLIAKLPTMVAAIYRIQNGDKVIEPRNDISFAANFYWMLHEKEPDPIVEKIINALMIIHADHGFNNSTFCCRNVGSSLANIYTAISSAIGSLSGPLHGGAAEEAIEMLIQVGSPENAEGYIHHKLEKKIAIPGLGHRIYKVKDPRAQVLQKLLREYFDKFGINSPHLEIAERIEQITKSQLGEMKGVYPNVDFLSGLLEQEVLKVPTPFFPCLFAMARVSGWCAHYLEVVNDDTKIYRPSQKYTGLKDQPYLPLDNR